MTRPQEVYKILISLNVILEGNEFKHVKIISLRDDLKDKNNIEDEKLKKTHGRKNKRSKNINKQISKTKWSNNKLGYFLET